MECLQGNYLSVIEAADILGVSAIRVQQLCQSGRLPAVKFARDWLIHEESIRNHAPGKRGPRTNKEKLADELAGIREELAAVAETKKAEGE
ncbi:MAG: helix-turn-helix domain-containing protein [Synergistaceae bacterium]|jgi:excisionase family DNA binding protein|nr:helix-turn-helix domain-containing protein [Synergistaceae bacterium]